MSAAGRSADPGLDPHFEAALRDLAETRRQLEAGEIDHRTAEELSRRFELDAAKAIGARARIDDEDAHPGEMSHGRSAVRTLTGIVAVVVVIVVATVLLVRSADEREPGELITGNVDGAAGAGRDRSEVTNEEMEAVVAENPSVTGMRMRLADRYFAEGEYDLALDHYMAVLEHRDEPTAMARIAWILHDSGEVELAEQMVRQSLRRAPDHVEARWTLANIQLAGLANPQAAAETLRSLRDDPDLRREDRVLVENLLVLAEQALSDER
ncbi:tetratricopeptide repeat protein [Euzebya sp.]|uniref:tetratricopeptide repeat protein n=1 Tax=Euzebya sp. TaxID=1971409 RepID=UPI003510F1EE